MKTLLISGHSGRMGGEVARLAPQYGFDPHPYAPGKAGDVTVDFSHPDALPALLRGAGPLVIGTTGYDAAALDALQKAARLRPILMAENFSPGAFALRAVALRAQSLLPDWQITLIERHHAGKRDAPGGTARALAQALGLPKEQITALHAGTLRGVHEVTLYGPEETLTLLHLAESRAAFAHGALRAARWLPSQPPGLYSLEDMAAAQGNA